VSELTSSRTRRSGRFPGEETSFLGGGGGHPGRELGWRNGLTTRTERGLKTAASLRRKGRREEVMGKVDRGKGRRNERPSERGF